MSKSIYQLALEKRWTKGQMWKFIAGKKVKTIVSSTNNNSGHNYPAVFIARTRSDLFPSTESITSNYSMGDFEASPGNPNNGTGRSGIYVSEIALAENKINKNELTVKLDDLETKFNAEKEELESKLKSLKELELEEIEEELLDVVNAVSAVNPKAEPKDKIKLAEALMKVINK